MLDGLQLEERKASDLVSDADIIHRDYSEFVSLSKQLLQEEDSLRQISSDARTIEDVDKEFVAVQTMRWANTFCNLV